MQKKDHKQSDAELRKYLDRRQMESDENMRIMYRIIEDGHVRTDRILDDIQKTNRDNSLFLRMIFERVDRPQADQT